ncbi:hypothetical protein KKH13_05175 [Patescibacteria group bacterium]|nr:hypothetical protein [Patescibacteria group bacterium]
MRLRPLNDTLIVEPEGIERHEGLLILPDKNSEEKISAFAIVVSAGPKCNYKFKNGQRVLIDRFIDKPYNFILDGKKYRFIKEHYVHGVLENED